MSRFELIAIQVDEQKIENALQTYYEMKPYFQGIVDLYVKIESLEALKENDLVELLSTPKLFLAKKIVTDQIKGLNLDLEKAFDIMQKPDGCEELINHINRFKSQNDQTKFYHRWVEYFTVSNNVVEVKESVAEQIRNQQTLFINNEKQKEAYDLLNTISENINKLNSLQRIYHLDSALFETFLVYDRNTEKVTVNYNFLTKIS